MEERSWVEKTKEIFHIFAKDKRIRISTNIENY